MTYIYSEDDMPILVYWADSKGRRYKPSFAFIRRSRLRELQMSPKVFVQELEVPSPSNILNVQTPEHLQSQFPTTEIPPELKVPEVTFPGAYEKEVPSVMYIVWDV
jgi:hypothetical protein